MTKKNYKVIIVGAGPAGLTAAIYTARAGLSTLVIGNPYESQVAKLGVIENYPGFGKGVQGMQLIEEMANQTQANGGKIVYANVISIEKKRETFLVKSDEDEEFQAKVIIMAMGSRYRKMRIEGEEEYYAKGVSYCTVCDGALFKDKPTAIIGYGDGAAIGALYLANFSTKVYVITPKKELGAEAIYMHRLKTKDNIEIFYKAKVKKIAGDEFVNSIIFKDSEGKEQKIAVEGVFIEYGTVPNTLLAKQLGVEIDEKHFIIVDNVTLATNIPGVYAAGDVTGRIRQIATAVGDGCTAATYAQEYLEKLED